MGYYFVRLKGQETIEIMYNSLTSFWAFGSDEPIERSEVEILSGPFTIEKLYGLYINSNNIGV